MTEGSFFLSSRRRHTRFDCDWSSDVCSSDLLRQRRQGTARAARRQPRGPAGEGAVGPARKPAAGGGRREKGRGAGWGRGEESGGGGSLKKKKKIMIIGRRACSTTIHSAID